MMWCPFSPSSISSGTAASFDTIQVSFGLLSGRLAAHPGRRHPPDTVIMLNCASRCERISCLGATMCGERLRQGLATGFMSLMNPLRPRPSRPENYLLIICQKIYRAQSSSLRRKTKLPRPLCGTTKLAYAHDRGAEQVGVTIADVVTMLNVRSYMGFDFKNSKNFPKPGEVDN